jgi:hypothetical protein
VLIQQCHGLCTITNGFENARYLRVDIDKLFEPTYCHKHHDLLNCIICTNKKDNEVCMATLNALCLELKCSDDHLVPCDQLVKAKESGGTELAGLQLRM